MLPIQLDAHAASPSMHGDNGVSLRAGNTDTDQTNPTPSESRKIRYHRGHAMHTCRPRRYHRYPHRYAHGRAHDASHVASSNPRERVRAILSPCRQAARHVPEGA